MVILDTYAEPDDGTVEGVNSSFATGHARNVGDPGTPRPGGGAMSSTAEESHSLLPPCTGTWKHSHERSTWIAGKAYRSRGFGEPK